ncbi:uncharacterized protein LOC126680765 [Mercurialis annua]|uniref:uncharacterized protein LOC126680765 n=1 Tax=Mercurialis annua TaxID=3986 RepID=UPI00215E477E|nr:uncharacterized protein LOC126680765 [Mercurialis annua]
MADKSKLPTSPCHAFVTLYLQPTIFRFQSEKEEKNLRNNYRLFWFIEEEWVSPEKIDALLKLWGIEVPDSPVKSPEEDCDCGKKAGHCDCIVQCNFEYDSADDYDNDEQRQEFHRYKKQITDSEGFDVDFVPNFSFFGGTRPVDLNNENCGFAKWAKLSADLAIDHHNNQSNDENLELFIIEKANYRGTVVFLITLKAKGLVSGDIKVYQAEVLYDPFAYNHSVRFLRLKTRKNSEEECA